MLVGIGALPQSLFVPKNYTISVAAAIPYLSLMSLRPVVRVPANAFSPDSAP